MGRDNRLAQGDGGRASCVFRSKSARRRVLIDRADARVADIWRRGADRRWTGEAPRHPVGIALLRHPGIALAQLEQPVEPLVQWLTKQQLEILDAPTEYARRPQTMTDHARLLAMTLGLRSPANTDLPMMIEAAAQAAWSTDRGQPIAAAVVSALRAAAVASNAIERTAIAGRARARRRAADALLAAVSDEQVAKLDRLLVLDASVNTTSFAWLKAMPVAPEADRIRELLDRLRRVRDIGLPSEITRESMKNDCCSWCVRATHPMPTNSDVTLHAADERSLSRRRSISLLA